MVEPHSADELTPVAIDRIIETDGAFQLHTYVDFNRSVEYATCMNAKEFQRYLAKQGCTFVTHPGGSGHITVYRDGKKSQLPMHGGGKELSPGLVHKIKKQLGLK